MMDKMDNKNRENNIERTTPRGLWRYADAFYKGCHLIHQQLPHWDSDFSPNLDLAVVRYYLLGHSLELAFKAFLLKMGLDIELLKKEVGHNLNKCLRISEERGLNIFNDEEKAVIKVLNHYYENKDFEYIKIGAKSLPMPKDVDKISKKLLEEVRKKL